MFCYDYLFVFLIDSSTLFHINVSKSFLFLSIFTLPFVSTLTIEQSRHPFRVHSCCSCTHSHQFCMHFILSVYYAFPIERREVHYYQQLNMSLYGSSTYSSHDMHMCIYR